MPLRPTFSPSATEPGPLARLLVAICVGWIAPVASGQQPVDAAEAPIEEAKTETAPLRITVLGGSVSAGHAWRNYEEFSPDPDPVTFAEKHLDRSIDEREYELRTDCLPFADALRRLGGGSIRTVDLCHLHLHTAPERLLEQQLERVPDETEIVVSVDLFFWFGYGGTRRPPTGLDAGDGAVHEALERLAKQRTAFALVDAFLEDRPDVRLVVGDYPRFPAPDRTLILPSFEPSPLTLDTLNERLKTWADARPNVFVYPVADQIARLARSELEVRIDDATRKVGWEQFLQLDGLHPNRLCMAYATCELLRFFRTRLPDDLERRAPDRPTFADALEALGTSRAEFDELASCLAARR